MIPWNTGTLEQWYHGTLDTTVVCGETGGRIGGESRERSLEIVSGVNAGCNIM